MPILLKPQVVDEVVDEQTPDAGASTGYTSNSLVNDPVAPTVPEPVELAQVRRVRVSRYELSTLTTQLSIMLRAGVDLVSALSSLERQASGPRLKAVLASVQEEVLGGKSFSRALGRYEKTFGATYIATVAAGEVAGELPKVLVQLSKSIRGEMKLRKSLRAMMIYPLTLVGAACVVITGLVVFVLPKFADIFSQFGTDLPQITDIVLGIGNELNARGWLWGPIGIGAVVGVAAWWMSDAGKRIWDRTLVSGFLLRRVGKPLMIGRACRLMGLMLSSGVPLLETIRLTRNGMNSYTYSGLFNRIEDEVLNGRGMSDVLMKSSFIPSEAAEMLTTAEKTGSLAEVTILLADHFEELAESRLRELIAMLEPAVTIGMGLVVSGIVLSVLLPMFDLSTIADQQGF